MTIDVNRPEQEVKAVREVIVGKIRAMKAEVGFIKERINKLMEMLERKAQEE